MLKCLVILIFLKMAQSDTSKSSIFKPMNVHYQPHSGTLLFQVLKETTLKSIIPEIDIETTADEDLSLALALLCKSVTFQPKYIGYLILNEYTIRAEKRSIYILSDLMSQLNKQYAFNREDFKEINFNQNYNHRELFCGGDTKTFELKLKNRFPEIIYKTYSSMLKE